MIAIGSIPVIFGAEAVDLAILPFRAIYHKIFDEKNDET